MGSGLGSGSSAASTTHEALEEHLIECAMMKVVASEMLDTVVDEAVQIHGGWGYSEDLPVARAYRDARINRIFEGTTEINRLVVGGTLFRRSQAGRLPLFEAEPGACSAPRSVRARRRPEARGAEELAVELAILLELKRMLLVMAGAMSRRFGEELADEQEVLAGVADLAIEVFTIESVLLRAAKLSQRPDAGRASLAAGIARVTTAEGLGRFHAAARPLLALLDGAARGGLEEALWSAFHCLATPLIALRREIAASVLAHERYPFP